ncbi:MAG: serine hydrolase [Planctomycetota bacterium]|nr:serine hydrolase [Planctomycetota bacterium]
MKHVRRLKSVFVIAAMVTVCGCASHKDRISTPSEAWSKVQNATPLLQSTFNDATRLRLQIAVATIKPASGNQPARLERHVFRCGEEYFYPASTVKLLACVAALETLDDLRRTTGNDLVDADCPLTIAPLFSGDTSQSADESNVFGGSITVNHEIRKILLVSDNRAFNRLYDVVGRDLINARMHAAGLASVSITHRLSESRPIPDQAATAAVTVHTARGDAQIPARVGVMPLMNQGPGLLVGSGFIKGDKPVMEPMDFAARNAVSLIDLQNALAMVVRPDIDLGLPGFTLSEQDRARLIGAMTQYPAQSANPIYTAADHPDHYCKFFLPGLREWRPGHPLLVLNKVGQAYGFTIDNAYIEDLTTGEAFFLAATIYTNQDGILNDDTYEYTALAEPFMSELAREVARQLFPAQP